MFACLGTFDENWAETRVVMSFSLTVAGCRSLLAGFPHGDAAVVAGRVAVLPADGAAAFGGLCSRRRQRGRGQPGRVRGRRWRRGTRRHRSQNWFRWDVLSPGGLFLQGDSFICRFSQKLFLLRISKPEKWCHLFVIYLVQLSQ